MNRIYSVIVPLVLVLFTLSACGGETQTSEQNPQPENMAKAIDQHIENDNYPAAIELLNNANADEVANLSLLKEKVHLNYALYLKYRAEDQSMRDRMTNSLRQFIKTLQLNPKNDKARAEAEQIMDIYKTMPNKTVPEDIINDLNELGYNYSN